MREYFREEGLKFRYFPVFILMRLCLIALIFIAGQIQWLIVAAAAAFSFGFLYDTEAEHMLPVSYEEMLARRRLRVRMVWLRYLIICLASIAVHFVMMQNGDFRMDPHDSALLRRPLIPAFYFILQMIFIYNILLNASASQKNEKKKGEKTDPAKAFEKAVFYMLPAYIYFVYGAGFCINHFIYMGSQWIHILIIIVASILLTIRNIKISKELKLADFAQLIQKA